MAELTEVEAKGDESLAGKTVEIEGEVDLSATRDPSKPDTTKEEDRHTAQARHINMIWEVTQAAIALMIVGANVAAAFVAVTITGSGLLANAFFLVIGFYFGRTNHARTGGVIDISRKGR